MEDEKKALDELLFIKKVIEDSRKLICDNGMGYIVWGILTTIGMLGGYVKFKLHLHFDYIWAWVILISIGWIYSYFKFYRFKQVRSETFAGKLIGILWFSVGISNSIIGFLGYFSGAISGGSIASVVSVFLGAAYYISSLLHGKMWLKGIGIMWWIGGIVMFYVQGIEMFLIMSFLMMFGQVLPGIILYREYKTLVCETK